MDSTLGLPSLIGFTQTWGCSFHRILGGSWKIWGNKESTYLRIYGITTVSNQQHVDTVCCSGLWWGRGYHFDHMVIGKPSACDLPQIWTTTGYTTSTFGSVKRSVERVSGCHDRDLVGPTHLKNGQRIQNATIKIKIKGFSVAKCIRSRKCHLSI